MPILITLLAVALLLLLIIGLRWHAFIALLLVAILAGFALGMDASTVFATLQKGVGGTLGGIAIILGLGATLGGVIADTGAAQVISNRLIGDGSNQTKAIWLIGTVAFLIGIPLFYNAAFVLLAPIIFAVATRAKLPLAMVAVAGVAALSVTHGFLPPHPAPVFISGEYGADIGKVLLYGILLAVPSVIIAGPLFSSFFLRNMPHTQEQSVLQIPEAPDNPPSFGLSIMAALLPVLLIAAAALAKLFIEVPDSVTTGLPEPSLAAEPALLTVLGNETVALLIGVLFAIIMLARATQRKVGDLMASVGKHLAPMAAVLLIIAAGGAFKQILVDSGTSNYIVDQLQGFNANPLIIAWVIAAALRITLGSATVAAITAAGIALPLVGSTDVSPELLVLATGAGSLTCSHVNDTGFWLFKSYFGLTVTQTLKSWTVMETLVSVIGLIGCLLLDLVV
ncbi:hypothetical protein CEQ90_09560 [Lewinellaceae bacterium SD302]|nr:hypothetical protein CEQ90_09560 [Lewinellaceae bacterium SD302]